MPANEPTCNEPMCEVCRPSAVYDRRVVGIINRLVRSVRRRNSRPTDTLDEPVGDNHDQCYCEACKFKKFGTAKLMPVHVEEYDFKPRRLDFLKSAAAEKFGYFLGVELETDNNSGNDYVSNEIAAGMALPNDFWIPKRDGSVSGPEFASMPATLTWWRERRKEIEEMFTMLLHAGFSSHNGGHCGMHVNISRNAFDNARHIFRFLKLLHSSKKWALAMSQRTPDKVEQWATMSTSPRAWKRVSQGATTDKYNALHAPHYRHGPHSRYDRFEFRLPRGTLRADRFFKNLEWTVAMIEYTRCCRITQCNPTQFTKWAMDNAADWPELTTFIKEKFAGLWGGKRKVNTQCA